MSSEHLKLHLKLDDEKDKIKDISGNGNEIDVFVSGNPEVVDDELFGKCLSFDGSSYIDISGSAVSNHDEADFTVSVWANVDNLDNISSTLSPITFRDAPDAGTQGYSFYANHNNQNKWSIFIGTAIVGSWYEILGSDNIISDSWTNLTITYKSSDSGNELFFYINGQKQDIVSETFVPVTSEKSIRIGAGGTEAATGEKVTYHFIGKIAHLRIYDTALSDTEVWEMLLSSMKIENAEDITNRINNLNPDDLISLLTTMRQDKDLLEETEYLDDQQREEIASALKEYRVGSNWKSMMEIFNIN